jgi:capsid protein
MGVIELMGGVKKFFAAQEKSSPDVDVFVPFLEDPVMENIISKKAELQADFVPANYRSLFSVSYTGEKNLGEIGPVKDYQPAYQILRMRSWQSYLESDLTHTLMNRFITWMIGSGLKLQSEPAVDVLKSEGIELETHAFSKPVEARFNVFRKSVKSDYSEMKNLNLIAKAAYKNAIIGGDVLVILRYTDGFVNVQLIDGCHVQSPEWGTESFPNYLANGNRIINGIEQDPRGKHIRYNVRNKDNGFDIIECYGKKSGMQMAFMVYGLEYRLDSNRGIPMIAIVLETLKQMERYKSAAVGSAEERQKIAYFIQHGVASTGENPLIKQAAQAFNYTHDGSGSDDLPKDMEGKDLAKLVAATTNKQTFNLPVDSELKQLESKNELFFEGFFSINTDIVCACLNIPPNVAMSKYDSNFSASRANLKDWENTLLIGRDDFGFQFYQKIYSFWLELEILTNKIVAPGYLSARTTRNHMVLESYRMARFIGPQVPHIDPLKEVMAERAKLGAAGAALPLTTLEAATENLNGGESHANVVQYAAELEEAEELGIQIPVTGGVPSDDEENDSEDNAVDKKDTKDKKIKPKPKKK